MVRCGGPSGVFERLCCANCDCAQEDRRDEHGCRLPCTECQTPHDAYPLPMMEEALEIRRGAKFFYRFDLQHGYYQIPIAKEDIHKSAFRSGTEGLCEFTRMCFGRIGTSETSITLMDKLFGDLNNIVRVFWCIWMTS